MGNIKVNYIFRKAGKRVLNGLLKNEIEVRSGDDRLTSVDGLLKEEEMKIKYLHALNMTDYGVVSLDERVDGLFSEEYLKNRNRSGLNSRVFRASLYKYCEGDAGIPVVEINEYYLIADKFGKIVYGKLNFNEETGTCFVTMFKKCINIDQPVNLHSEEGVMAEDNCHTTFEIKSIDQLEEFLLRVRRNYSVYDSSTGKDKLKYQREDGSFDYTLGIFENPEREQD